MTFGPVLTPYALELKDELELGLVEHDLLLSTAQPLKYWRPLPIAHSP